MAVLLLTACEAPKELGVVPYPQYAQTTSKTVELPSTVTFSTNLAKSDMNDLLAYLPDFAIPMKLVDKNPFVTIEITDATDNPIAAEGYNLTVSKQGVNIQASSAAGAFYGLQTLAQLVRNGKKLPVTTIKDEPRFPYRGLHLDVSRHFFNTDYVKKQIDLVATYKNQPPALASDRRCRMAAGDSGLSPPDRIRSLEKSHQSAGLGEI